MSNHFTNTKYLCRGAGWRLGLQAVAGLVFSTFLLGTFYRSASLYHPQVGYPPSIIFREYILFLKSRGEIWFLYHPQAKILPLPLSGDISSLYHLQVRYPPSAILR
jgi:hypothetical protein